MRADYLIPVATALGSLLAFALLTGVAWRSRPGESRARTQAERAWRPEQRDAYGLTRTRVLSIVTSSLVLALAAGVAMAAWLPLPPLEQTLLATLAAPLLWGALLAFLLSRSGWVPYALGAFLGGCALLGGVLAGMLGS